MSSIADHDFDDAIHQARNRLDAFERSASSGELVVRLRASSPLHPFLVMRALALLATLATVVLAILALALPVFNHQFAEIIGRLDDASGVPLFLVLAVLTLCFFGMALGAHFAALVSARNAPLLPHEAKVHQRLVADLQQLEAQRAVQQRLTPMSAEPRTRSGRGAPVRR
ncbi:MAG: hypothetical protein ABMB14_22115 [Myxococcota bacterium]